VASEPAADVGHTHVALPVSDVDASVAFYERYADMRLLHDRVEDDGARVVWIGDLTRPFIVVLIQTNVSHTLGGFAHLGVGCTSREQVDARCADASAEGRTVLGPMDHGPPVGYWGIIADPDGHNLELSHGQSVGFTVEHGRGPNAT